MSRRKFLTEYQKKYKVDSGMGGSFTVIIVEEDENNKDRVKVRCTNQGWETLSFWRNRADLEEITQASPR